MYGLLPAKTRRFTESRLPVENALSAAYQDESGRGRALACRTACETRLHAAFVCKSAYKSGCAGSSRAARHTSPAACAGCSSRALRQSALHRQVAGYCIGTRRCRARGRTIGSLAPKDCMPAACGSAFGGSGIGNSAANGLTARRPRNRQLSSPAIGTLTAGGATASVRQPGSRRPDGMAASVRQHGSRQPDIPAADVQQPTSKEYHGNHRQLYR